MTDRDQAIIRWRTGVLSMRLGLRTCAMAAVSRAGTLLLWLSAQTAHARCPAIARRTKSGAGRCYQRVAVMNKEI